MPKFDLKILEELENAVKEISAQQDLVDSQKIKEAVAAAQIMLAAAAAAQAQSQEELKSYSKLLADQSGEILKAAIAENIEQFAPEQFQSLFEQASEGYRDFIRPILDEYQKAPDSDSLQVDNHTYMAIASLGLQIYKTSKAVYALREEMEPKERIMALAGTLLMFAGVCLMIAAIANPQIGIPLFATITMVNVGITLCQQSTKRLKNEAVNTSLEIAADKAKQTSDVLNNRKPAVAAEPARTSLNFSNASDPAASKKSEKPDFVQDCTNFIKKLFNPKNQA